MTFGNGGAVFSTHLQQRLLSLLPQVTINNGMGTSESGMIGGGPRPGQGEGFMRLAPREDLAVIDDTLKIVTEVGAEGSWRELVTHPRAIGAILSKALKLSSRLQDALGS